MSVPLDEVTQDTGQRDIVLPAGGELKENAMATAAMNETGNARQVCSHGSLGTLSSATAPVRHEFTSAANSSISGCGGLYPSPKSQNRPALVTLVTFNLCKWD
ncbi:MAG TPA: hypothetical protein VFB00_10880 [Terriglobales bacterium]|nr:hypothetical protein [Terriglobales bacterium]